MAQLIRATGLPVVASSLEEPTWDRPHHEFCEIRTDSPAIAQMAALHLMEQGLRYFGFCGFDTCQWSIRREQAFTQFLTEAGFACYKRRIQFANWLQRPGGQNANRLPVPG